MHVNVGDILQQGEGSQLDFNVEAEKPMLEDVTLASPISGSLRVVGTKDGVLVSANLETDVRLECHRCLRPFDHHLELPVEAQFSLHPEEDQFEIDKHGKIDLAEPVRQEILVRLPLQQLCQVDCAGIKLTQ